MKPFFLLFLLGLLVLGSGGPSGCGRPGPARPAGYRVTVPRASQTRRLVPLQLAVYVVDRRGAPVDNVPVHFRLPQQWAPVAEVVPTTVVTQHGRAVATFRARTAGRLVVQVVVADLAIPVHITVYGEVPRF